MHIDVNDQTHTLTSHHIDLLRKLLEYTAQQEEVPSHAEISLNFVDNHTIQEINLNYRQKNEPTDVISFAMQEVTEGEVEIKGTAQLPHVLGDIVISVERAKEQANDLNHSFEREISFLAVHGFLHLLGYDHIEKADEEVMFKRQATILSRFGLER